MQEEEAEEQMEKEQFYENQKYLLRLRMWADRRLKELGQSEELHTRGTGILELDAKNILDSLSPGTKGYRIEEDAAFIALMDDLNREAGGKTFGLGQIASLFGLNVVEEICLFLSVLPEIDGAYGKVFGWLNGDPHKTRPVMEVAAVVMGFDQMMKSQVRERLEQDSSFVRYILEDGWKESKEPFWSRELVPDSRIAGWVLGIETGTEALKQYSAWITPEDKKELEEESRYLSVLLHACEICQEEQEQWEKQEKQKAVCLYGKEGGGKKELLKQYSEKTGKRILLLHWNQLEEEKQNSLVGKAIREAVLTGSILAVEYDPTTEAKQQAELWKELTGAPSPLILISQEQPSKPEEASVELIPVHIEDPTYEERCAIWQHYLEQYGIETEEGTRLAVKFAFLPGQIRGAVRHYKNALRMHSEETTSLYESCFSQLNHQLYERASKINTKYSWNQLILPDSQKQLMHDICAQMENKYTVYDTWGFGKTVAYGKGVTVVFSGPPGTGKTMAAQILAKELNLELFKIDLSQMVSKYVGETEKNLASVFHEAEISNAILFFDEADSLFGQRSEVKSSNDRYANLETSYLLQRLEEYEGMTVLATNYLKNIDEAFMRRMKYIIQFQFPDAAARQQIWRVTMPKEAPISPDIDYEFLGNNLELAGGSIKNVVVYAAFMAADQGKCIGMGELLKAARYEMQKTGKILLEKDLKQYGYLL